MLNWRKIRKENELVFNNYWNDTRHSGIVEPLKSYTLVLYNSLIEKKEVNCNRKLDVQLYNDAKRDASCDSCLLTCLIYDCDRLREPVITST